MLRLCESHSDGGPDPILISATFLLFKTSVYEGLKGKGKGDITVCFRQWK